MNAAKNAVEESRAGGAAFISEKLLGGPSLRF